jgi:hypothetical protein
MILCIVATNLAVIQLARKAINEDEEEWVEGLYRSVRLEGGSACKVDRIYKGVRIRRDQGL